MKRPTGFVLSMAAACGGALLLTACHTRSISDSDCRGRYGHGGKSSWEIAYRGELTEWDVLGTSPTNVPPGAYQPVTLKKGERVLVIQSGAFMPDGEMLAELQRHFSVATFSGIPPKEKDAVLAERLRSAALNGGCERLLVYWGVLETAQQDQVTRTVSWVPVVGRLVPDRTQKMRILVKGAAIDARSGRWTMFVADSIEDERLSAKVAREASDQGQVARLKALAYRNLVQKTF